MLYKISIACIFVLIVAFGGRGYFAKDEIALDALTTLGYTNIRVTNKSILLMPGCVRGDSARFTVSATSPQGKDVTLYVCTSWPFGRNTISVP